MKLFHAVFLFLFSIVPHRTYIIDPVSAQTVVSSPFIANAATLPPLPTPSKHPAADIYALVPVLRSIAACESTGDKNGTPRQFNSDGSILWGEEKDASGTTIIVKRDVGELQINTEAHGEYPDGLDVIHSEDDNVYFGYLLYMEYGVSPWVASKNCWAPTVQNSTSSVNKSGEK